MTYSALYLNAQNQHYTTLSVSKVPHPPAYQPCFLPLLCSDLHYEVFQLKIFTISKYDGFFPVSLLYNYPTGAECSRTDPMVVTYMCFHFLLTKNSFPRDKARIEARLSLPREAGACEEAGAGGQELASWLSAMSPGESITMVTGTWTEFPFDFTTGESVIKGLLFTDKPSIYYLKDSSCCSTCWRETWTPRPC